MFLTNRAVLKGRADSWQSHVSAKNFLKMQSVNIHSITSLDNYNISTLLVKQLKKWQYKSLVNATARRLREVSRQRKFTSKTCGFYQCAILQVPGNYQEWLSLGHCIRSTVASGRPGRELIQKAKCPSVIFICLFTFH